MGLLYLAPKGLLLAGLIAMPDSALANSCQGDSSLVQPFLNSDKDILKKCSLSVKARADRIERERRQEPACVSTWKKMNDCAADYLKSREAVCASLSRPPSSSGSQLEEIQAARGTAGNAATAQQNLARQLRQCIREARASQEAQGEVIARLQRDHGNIERALRSAQSPQEAQTILSASQVGP
jgi:hypothetical protein